MSAEFDKQNQEVRAESSEDRQKENKADLIAQCREYVQQPVRLQTNDGGYYEGMLEHVDNDYVYLITTQNEGLADYRSGESRQPFGYGSPFYGSGYGGYYGPGYGGYYGGYPYHGYPYGYGYGYPGRINRLILPLAALTAITLLPYY